MKIKMESTVKEIGDLILTGETIVDILAATKASCTILKDDHGAVGKSK